MSPPSHAATIERLQVDVETLSREQERVSATLDAAALAYSESTRRLTEKLVELGQRLERFDERLDRLDVATARLEGVVEGRASATPARPVPSEAPKAAARAQVDVARWTAWSLVLAALITALSTLGVAWLAGKSELPPVKRDRSGAPPR